MWSLTATKCGGSTTRITASISLFTLLLEEHQEEANPFKLPEIFPAYKDRHRHSLIIILLRIRHHYFLFFPCLILLRTNLNCRRNCSTRMRPLSIFLVENECTIYLENYKSKRTLYSIRAKVVNKWKLSTFVCNACFQEDFFTCRNYVKFL